MDDCVFCKIVKGELPCYSVYEDPNFLAFLDIRPLNPGHTLVIPKKHYRWVWDVEDSYFTVIKKVANGIKKALNAELIIGLVVGEEVPHAHFWLVPRFKDDGHGAILNFENIKKISKEEMQEIAEKIKKEINA